MTGSADILKREHKAAEKFHICFKQVKKSENEKLYTSLYRGAAHKDGSLKNKFPTVFPNLSVSDTHKLIKELRKRIKVAGCDQ